MSTPEQPLTRKQLRELQRTGAVAVPAQESTDVAEQTSPASAPRPKAAEEVAQSAAPTADADVDLSAPPLTRRQARQQERIRTASVPVVSSETEVADAARSETERTLASVTSVEADSVGASPAPEEPVSADPVDSPQERPADREEADTPAPEAPVDAAPDVPETSPEAPERGDTQSADSAASPERPEAGAQLRDGFGAHVLDRDVTPVAARTPPSFDELIARNASTSTQSTPSALILSQTPSGPSLSGPVTATGEVILTGSYPLPEGLGSAGSDPRATDGKDVDSVLVDGELPAASSPTPIAASAAISTHSPANEIIRPPAPEKGSRLVLTLAITAGALMVAVIGVVVVAFVTGAFG